MLLLVFIVLFKKKWMCLNESASPGMILGGGSVVLTRGSQLVSPSPESGSQVTLVTNRTNIIMGEGLVTAIITGHRHSRWSYPVSNIFVPSSIYFWLDDTISPLHWSISELWLSTSPLPGRRSSTGVRASVSVSWVSHLTACHTRLTSHQGTDKCCRIMESLHFGTLAAYWPLLLQGSDK